MGRQQRVALRGVRRGKGKIQPIKIEIKAGEGPTWTTKKLHSVTQPDIWRKADKVLFDLAAYAPKSGGYNKIDFKVYFADGDTYSGRYDLKHYSLEMPSLSTHMSQNINFYTGLYRPPHLSEEQYRQVLAYDSPQTREMYRKMARTYDVPGFKVANPRDFIYPHNKTSNIYKLRFERTSWPDDDFIGTIRTVPENYYVATVNNRGQLNFTGIEGMTQTINKQMVRNWWKAQRNLSNPYEKTKPPYKVKKGEIPDYWELAYDMKHAGQIVRRMEGKFPSSRIRPLSQPVGDRRWVFEAWEYVEPIQLGGYMKTVPFDTTEENPNMPAALKARARYQEDMKAGHGAAEYWRGQAGAFFTGNPIFVGWRQIGKDLILTDKDNIQHAIWAESLRVPKGFIRPARAGQRKYKEYSIWESWRQAVKRRFKTDTPSWYGIVKNPGLGITGAAGSLASRNKINPRAGWMYRFPGSTYANGPVQAGSKKEAMAIVRKSYRLKLLPAGTEFWYSRGSGMNPQQQLSTHDIRCPHCHWKPRKGLSFGDSLQQVQKHYFKKHPNDPVGLKHGKNPLGAIAASLGAAAVTGMATGAGVGAGLISARKILTGKAS